ncbi:hypothetical protein [Streptomyces aidingensis]|uniref:hypothetical protein n=1 Tax=Streptomyces aidingensis TaxID=910347 RepID=UPI001FE95EF5|nr:hypothetical protein [Streptomyces aidingensis]
MAGLAGPATAALLPLPLLAAALAALPGSFTGGGTRRWGRGRVEDLRSLAQGAKHAAAEAFYQLDTAQREVRISIETIGAADGSPQGARAAAEFSALGERIDQVSHRYISTVDAHDLDSPQLDAATATRAQQELSRIREEMERTRADLERFAAGLAPLLQRAEQQLARLAPAVEQAKRTLLAATEALDAARAAGFAAEESAAALAALGPELRLLNEGAARHGVQATLGRAEQLHRQAEAIRAEAAELPRRAGGIDRRLASLRTRAEAISTRAGQVEPVLSELRRRFSAACWQDLQRVPEQAAESVRRAEDSLREAQRARETQRWADAQARIAAVQELLARTDELVDTAGDRLRRLNEVSFDPQQEIERTRFAVRDAQRLAMAGRSMPDPRHARPLDDAVERLDAAVAALEEGGRNPDYWRFLCETRAVRDIAAAVVDDIRGTPR